MTQTAPLALPPEHVAAAFEHSITWEDDIWQADPVDVEQVHANARTKFFDLLVSVVEQNGETTPARILLFHGQSGAGKTHLIRALRTASHKRELAYFGYAQMTPDVSNYADYFLKRLLTSLEKAYDPTDATGETGLARLTRKLVSDCEGVSQSDLEALVDGDFNELELAQLVHDLADRIISGSRFANEDFDVNVVRALLYLHCRDPRIDQRVRHYLQGRQLNALSQASVAALDPNTSDGRAFEIIETLGRLMSTVDHAALVFCIDQVEDLRFFDDSEERFQRAVRDLIQIANRLPTAIVVISCLDDFYGDVRKVVAQSYIDRIEKTGPVALLESRTPEEAKLIIAKRLKQELASKGGDPAEADPTRVFGPNFHDEFGGLSTRRLLEHAQNWLKGRGRGKQGSRDGDATRRGSSENGSVGSSGAGGAASNVVPVTEQARGRAAAPAVTEAAPASLISTLAAALGFGGDSANEPIKPPPAAVTQAAANAAGNVSPVDTTRPRDGIDYREMWEKFANAFEAELTDDDGALLDAISAGLTLAAIEWGDDVQAKIDVADLDQELPALDITIEHSSGHGFDGRVFLCNRPTQGGGFKRQLEKVVANMGDRTCFMVRASEFPPSKKNQAAQVFRKYREGGGRHMMVAIPEWERMLTAREFHLHHRNDPGFAEWFADAKLVSGLVPIAQILRLDLLGQDLPPMTAPTQSAGRSLRDQAAAAARLGTGASGLDQLAPANMDTPFGASPVSPLENPLAAGDRAAWDQELPEEGEPAHQEVIDAVLAPSEPEPGSIEVGTNQLAKSPIHIPQPIMKRHCAVLGGSGSGKTTLALSIIEQLLIEGIPAILIDRKGDLSSYANPDVWAEISGEDPDRAEERARLAENVDVAVYTPGRSAGRPISITLLPSGACELPDEELELLARHSAEAIGDMLHLKKSATNQKQMGTLQVALKLLGARSTHEIMLADLINLLETDDPELDERMQRMDPSGKLRRDLVAQLDSLRYRNAALFEAGGENMRMEALLGLGDFAKPDRTRLSVIYTGFLGDNENILFWVSQFLSEALRFCQRNPNDELQAVVMFDEADLYIPANAKPATAEPLQSLLKRARSAGLGIMLATQSPGDLDYKSRDQITSWFIGRVREDTALRKLKAAFQSESGLNPAAVLPGQTVGEFHLVQERLVRPMRAHRSLIQAEQVPFDRIETLAAETQGQDDVQLALFQG